MKEYTVEQINPKDIQIKYAVHKLPMSKINHFKKLKRWNQLTPYEGYVNVYKDGNSYVLLSGRLGYEIANISEQTKLTARVYAYPSREEYFKDMVNNSTVSIKINDIKIPRKFKKRPPRKKKLYLAEKYYLENGRLDKLPMVELVRNKNGNIEALLTDRYTRFLVARKLGFGTIECVVENEHVEIDKI